MKYNPLESAVKEEISFTGVQSIADWEKLRFYRYDLPAKALRIASKLPFVGNKNMLKKSQMIKKLSERMQVLTETYELFELNTWKFDDK